MDGKLIPGRTYYALLALVAVAGLGAVYGVLMVLGPMHWLIRYDLRLYQIESAWTATDSVLYRDLPSEYPPAANLLFAACHIMTGSDLNRFVLVWMSAAWLVYVGAGHLIATRIGLKALGLWLVPSAVYFSCVRFDIYPAAASLLALLAFRENRVLRGAFWFGLAIALKGYALFALPALLVYVLRNRGWRTALIATVLCLGPMMLGNLAVLSYGGWEGMLSPYRFHARRVNFGESTYDALYYLLAFCFDGPPVLGGTGPVLVQLACALGAAALRPKSFAELVHACLLGMLGFMSFSVFYSPQYILWLLPVAAFSEDRTVRRLAIAGAWLTFLYYPIFHVAGSDAVTLATAAEHGGALKLVLFRACVVGVTLVRFALMLAALRLWMPAKESWQNHGWLALVGRGTMGRKRRVNPTTCP